MEATGGILRLIEPTEQYMEAIWQFREAMLGSSFDGCSTLEQCSSAREWLEHIERCKQGKTEHVPATTYLAIRQSDNALVGIIDLRHHINHPILSTWGGHIGYCVHPMERGKGYAKEMLRLNLLNCKRRGIDRVLMTCDAANVASERVILANGGVYECTMEVDGNPIKRYWIDPIGFHA